MTDDADELGPFRTFWLASELSEVTGPAFAARVSDFAPSDGLRRFTYAGKPADLPRPAPHDPLARLLAERRSTRVYAAGGALGARQLGEVLSALADTPPGRRAWPAAGGLYGVEVFAFLLAVDHELSGRIVHYEPDLHAVTDVGASPPWDDLGALLSAQAIESQPDLVVLLVLDVDAVTTKYGNRGGRFALLEAGHAAENLALRLAASGLAGCELGGAYDRDLLALLGLRTTDALVGVAYAVGRPVPAPRRSAINSLRRRRRRQG